MMIDTSKMDYAYFLAFNQKKWKILEHKYKSSILDRRKKNMKEI
jgi:hypothetical protein